MLALAAATLVLSAAAGPAAAVAPPGRASLRCAATIAQGGLRGAAERGTCAFRGIRYAAAPVGALRFRPPQPPPSWRGTLRATRAGPICPQDRDLLEQYPDRRPRYTDEDCLRVNVWTPRPDGRRRPVMVFVPGGAFVVGAGSEPLYDGGPLARRGGVVVVTLNYRLGMLGWLELGRLDPAYRGSGNNGLRDQIAALRWVRRNIARFGGDPREITVFGESAGGISVSALLATAHPERLFRRAIAQSGSGYLVHTRAYQEEIARRHIAIAGVRSVRALLAMSASRILDIQKTAYDRAPLFSGDTYFAPYVDGAVLPGPVVRRVAAGSARKIDLLSGTTENETQYWGLYDPALLTLPPAANPFFPGGLSARRAQITATYRRDRPTATDGEISHAMLTDQLFRVPQIRLAQAQARWRPRNDFAYWFRWRRASTPAAGPYANLGAVHAIELPFVFGNLDLSWIPRGRTSDPREIVRRRTLSDRVMDAWISFALTGSPNARRGRGVPYWPAYGVRRRATMAWNLRPAVVDAPADRERRLWDGRTFDAWDFVP